MREVLPLHGIYRKSISKEITVSFLNVKESCRLGMEEGTTAITIPSVAQDQDNRIVEYAKSCDPVPGNWFVLKINS